MLRKDLAIGIATFVGGALTLCLISIPARVLIGADPMSVIGFAIASLLGGCFFIITLAIFRHGKTVLEQKVEERTGEIKAANERLLAEMEERKKTEDQLRQSHKMEAIGRLAGGVAHDINNVLTAIMTITSIIDLNFKQGVKELREDDIRDILDACKRGRELTLSLLGFARKGDYEKKPMLLSKAVAEVIKLLYRVIPRTITIKTELNDNGSQISGDLGQIKNSLMNLCINAVDAMNGKGVLTITTESTTLTNSQGDVLPGEYVKLVVKDTGCGMSDETVARAFDPFFTTKPEGKGTGLGLSRVYGVVKDHDGTISINSSLGRGTTMTLLLPCLDPTEQDPNIQFSTAPSSPAQVVRVLMVDDEAIVRKSVRRLLNQLGYEVLLAENGAEAVELFRKEHREISLIILDMIMPVMDGEEAFYKLREINPEIPILICSGYSNEGDAKKLLTFDHVSFVQKPFSPGALSVEITTLLDRPTAP